MECLPISPPVAHHLIRSLCLNGVGKDHVKGPYELTLAWPHCRLDA